jgi:hypothetical protein
MSNNEAPRVYRILPNFDSKCRNCGLSNGCAIGGHSFRRTSEVELIIVAAYPAREEVKKGYSLAPNQLRPKVDKPNAGRYVKYSSIFHFDWDVDFPKELKPFYDRIAFTNVIKCSPFTRTGDKLDVKDKHIKACKSTWLEKEIAMVAQYNPTCPILLCGSEAAKLLSPKQKVYSSRRKHFMYNNTHPVLVTFNPVEVVRYTAYEITKSKTNSKGKLFVEEVKPEKPVVVGSTTWHWKQDMESVKKLVLANYKYRNKENKSEFKRLLERYK